MSNLFEDMNFSCDSFDVSNIYDFAFFKNFDGHLLAGDGVNAKFDLSESSFTEIFGNYVVSDSSAFLKGRLRFLHCIKGLNLLFLDEIVYFLLD